LENRAEFRRQGLLELFGLILQNGLFAEVKHLFTQELENIQHIFTFCLGFACGLANVRYEIVPADGPFLFDNRNQSGIQLRQQMAPVLLELLIFSHVQNQLDNALSDTLFVLIWQNFPPCINSLIQNGQCQKFAMRI